MSSSIFTAEHDPPGCIYRSSDRVIQLQESIKSEIHCLAAEPSRRSGLRSLCGLHVLSS